LPGTETVSIADREADIYDIYPETQRVFIKVCQVITAQLLISL